MARVTIHAPLMVHIPGWHQPWRAPPRDAVPCRDSHCCTTPPPVHAVSSVSDAAIDRDAVISTRYSNMSTRVSYLARLRIRFDVMLGGTGKRSLLSCNIEEDTVSALTAQLVQSLGDASLSGHAYRVHYRCHRAGCCLLLLLFLQH